MSQTTAGFMIIAVLIAWRLFWLWRYSATSPGMTVRISRNDGDLVGTISTCEWVAQTRDYLLEVDLGDGLTLTCWRFECVAVLR